MRFGEFPGQFRIVFLRCLGDVEERFKPEVGDADNLLAFLHELDWQVVGSKFAVGAYLCGDAG
ncbi:MAG: hypothetical protein F4171_15330 [Gammaproteobacteria bacterium]|nr:hypothetical protein [Gammaproteobacteria bacterium]